MSKIYAWASVKNTWEGRPSIYFRLPCTLFLLVLISKCPNFLFVLVVFFEDEMLHEHVPHHEDHGQHESNRAEVGGGDTAV